MSTTDTPRPPESTTVPIHAPTASPGAGAIARQEFGAQELAVFGDVSSRRAAAEAAALVQARYVMALQRPRDWDDVRVRLMREVERPGFAEVAWYRKPVGQGVEGLSVRFAEAAARCMGNLLIDPQVTYEDERKRVVRVTATDLEANLTVSLDVTVEKTVERTNLSDGRVAISMRKNSQNKLTYLVPATEDELLGKTNSLVSKARRNLVLQILPGDITDQAKARILAIRRGDAAKDPEGARRKVVDAFANLNVMPSDLKRWLGHDIAQASPAEITELRDLYSAIQSGETTWADALAEKVGDDEAAAAAGEKKPGLAGVTERLQQRPPAGTGAPPQDCAHPDVPVNLAPGTTATCQRCGQVLEGPAREPGSDDGPPAAAVAAVKNLATAATTQGDRPKGRQGRLTD